MRKLKPIPELASLTDAQLETLDGWLADHPVSKVAQLAAAPAPEGFGLKIGRETLSLHHLRHQAAAQFRAHRALVGALEELKLGLPAGRMEDVFLDLVEQKAYSLMLQPEQAPQTLKTLLSIATFRRRQELAEGRLRLAEHRAGLNPTRPAARSEDIPVRQPAQTAPASPPLPSQSSPKAPAFAPPPSDPPSARQAAEFQALAKAVGLTEEMLADKLLDIMYPEAPAPAQTPTKAL